MYLVDVVNHSKPCCLLSCESLKCIDYYTKASFKLEKFFGLHPHCQSFLALPILLWIFPEVPVVMGTIGLGFVLAARPCKSNVKIAVPRPTVKPTSFGLGLRHAADQDQDCTFFFTTKTKTTWSWYWSLSWFFLEDQDQMYTSYCKIKIKTTRSCFCLSLPQH